MHGNSWKFWRSVFLFVSPNVFLDFWICLGFGWCRLVDIPRIEVFASSMWPLKRRRLMGIKLVASQSPWDSVFIWVFSLLGDTCTLFQHIFACFCVGLYDRVVAHCPKCFFCMSELIQSCRNGRSIHFATSTRLWPSHRRSSTAACLHFSLSQSVSITHVSGGFWTLWTRMSRMWRDDSCGHN